jgi:Flp pilus assembly protein TadD
LYLALPGLLLAAGSLTWRAVANRRVVRIALTGVLAVLAVATYRRNELWANPMELWEESVRRAPHAWQAHWGHAELLRELGNCERARSEYRAALQVYPGHAGARAGLAACRQP